MEVPNVMKKSPENKLSWVRSVVIGESAEFKSPFGSRRITYADTTASGRSLRFIEDYILAHVLPFYGNTHTGDSYVGQSSTKMLEEASRYIKTCMGGGDEDAILFCGSGTTSAIKRLQEVMGIAVPPMLRDRVFRALRDEERWVVFVGPYEHHSNLLSWRQSLAEVVEIGFDEDGSIDMVALRTQLERYEPTNRPMLGTFSACSNVTGIITDTSALATLLHQYGAFVCFDFAASGPYVKINMNSGEIDGYDAVFVSPHKFIGGPGSPGILLMNKKLYQLNNCPPSTCGGGTVSYVNGFSNEDTLYYENVEERENAGTPQITQTIRAALAFWIKEYIGYKTIQNQEHKYLTKALETLGKIRNVQVLGNFTSMKRLAIVSFLVYATTTRDCSTNRDRKHYDKKPLHGRFVAKLLNDLFGIQARGGCACAGPYGHYLLNVDKDYSLALRSSIQQGYEGIKPAWTRIGFPYYMSEEEFQFILDSIQFIATFGHRFLSVYNLNWRTGDWAFNEKAFRETFKGEDNKISNGTHVDDEHLKLSSFMQKLKLRDYKPNHKKLMNNDEISTKDKSLRNKYSSYIETARYIAAVLSKSPQPGRVPDNLRHINLPFKI